MDGTCMNHATQKLLHRWYRECRPRDGLQRRRALLARSRLNRRDDQRFEKVVAIAKQQSAQNTALQRRNAELVDKLKALQDRVPIYTRVQQNERHYGQTYVVTVAFNHDAIVRTLLLNTAERSNPLELTREFHYLADLASEKILATLREAAAEHLGMPGRSR